MCVLVFILVLAIIILKSEEKVNSDNRNEKGAVIMTKDFGVKPYLFPMPTYMIGTYNEDDTVDVMMMAWGGICAEDMVALNLEEDHKTVANLKEKKAFTLAVPGIDTIEQSDFFGIASANRVKDKFERSGLHAVKSSRVNAPVITEYPLTLECEVIEMQEQPYGLRVLGRIVNVIADEKILNEKEKIDCAKIGAFAFDQVNHGYYAIGEQVGKAWNSGSELMKKQ